MEQKKSYRLSVALFLCLLLITLLSERLRPLSIIVLLTGCVLLSSMKTEDKKHVVPGQRYLYSSKSRITALLLCCFLGLFGVYVGKIGTGILFLFTLGGFGIGWLIDLIRIACGVFRDSQGCYLKEW